MRGVLEGSAPVSAQPCAPDYAAQQAHRAFSTLNDNDVHIFALTQSRASRLSLIPKDIRFLHRFGIGLPTLRQATENAAFYKITPAEALIRAGMMSEEHYYHCAAEELGLVFVDHTPSQQEPFLEAPPIEVLEKMAFDVPVEGGRFHHLAPDMGKSDQLKCLIERTPGLRHRLRVTTRRANLDALEHRASPGLLRRAIEGLRERAPHFSAKQVITPMQATILVIAMQALFVALFYASGIVLTVLHLLATLAFFACAMLRLVAAIIIQPTQRKPRPRWQTEPSEPQLDDLPIYSVLVALHKEASQVPDLVRSLSRLDWPRERLEIKLVCEADDEKTVAAVKAALARTRAAHMTAVLVPPSQPRTKPKALNHALPLCRGRFLVIYDAEDRPEPSQLKSAYAEFERQGDQLACVQAPLIIHNHSNAWLSRLFAIEYSSLFDGMLPALAQGNLPLPLGGTSNHFRRAALESVGGWDPFNVTEDADLGVRLARCGYRTDTISVPTHEEAPETFVIWRNQRTRWFKGWMQTWLVHMRHPVQLARDLGFAGTVAFHVLTTGMIVSALVHPILIYFVLEAAWTASTMGLSALAERPLLALDLTTIVLGYGAFAALAWRTLPIRGLSHLKASLWTVPFYWMLLSVAAWRALWHLVRRPHHWEKTPHGKSNVTLAKGQMVLDPHQTCQARQTRVSAAQ